MTSRNMLTTKGQHTFYPLISLLSNALAYAGHGLLDAHAPNAKMPTAITIIATFLINVRVLKSKMFNNISNTKLIDH
jgi:hypothetical protein